MSAADQEPSRPPLSWRRAILPLCVVAVIVYGITLIATTPARTVLNSIDADIPVSSTSGTIWHGNALLADGTLLKWRGRPLASLTRLAFVADWQLRGAKTVLEGKAALRPERVHLTTVSGRAGWPLVSSLTGIFGSCDLEAIIDVDTMTLGKGSYALSGEARSPGGTCQTGPQAEPVVVPALSLVSITQGGASELTITPSANPDTVFLTARLTETGTLSIDLMDDGAALLPADMPRGAMSLEMEL